MGTLVQSARGTAAAQAFGSNVVSGNLLVGLIGGFHDTATVNTPTDTRGTTYVQAGTLLRANPSSPRAMLAIYYGIAPGSGANTQTFTFTGGTPGDMEHKVFEVSGVDTVTPVPSGHTAGTTGTSAAAASGSITTTIPGWILKAVQEYGWVSHDHAAGTPTTGWTEYGDQFEGADSAYRNETGTGTFNGGFTLGASTDWSCRIVAFADASGAVGQPASKRWGGVTHMNQHRGAGKRW